MNTVKLINRLFFGSKPGSFTDSEKESMSKAFGSVLKRQAENAGRFPGLAGMREALREVRSFSVGNDELFDEAVENLRKNNFKVLVAESLDAAFDLFIGEIAGEKLVVKSKSNISKEMHLTERCARLGIKAVETDIGDRILQLDNGRPSHPTGPVSHMSRQHIARVLSRELGREVPADAEALVAAVKEEIVEAIGKSRIGVTGANAITAREGSVLIIHNEGNITEISRLAGKHIIIADSAKIYPTLEDAISMVKMQTYSATGAVTTSYMNVISGVSKTADIEKKLIYGVHGPSEVVLILVKRGAIEDELRESAFCIGCGGCLPVCPAYAELGSAFGAYHKQGGIGVVQSAVEEGVEAAFTNGLYSCMKCGACTQSCPVSIDTPKMVSHIRELAATAPELKRSVRPFRMLAASVVLASGAKAMVMRSGRASCTTAYFPGCVSTVNTPKVRSDILGFMRAVTGGDVRVLEGCCGGAWETFGFRKEAAETFEALIRSLELKAPERIVVSCPHCYDALWHKNGTRLRNAGVGRVMRLTEFAQATTGKGDYEAKGGRKVAYHDACLFGRGMSIYDEPRDVLALSLSMEGQSGLIEMENSGKDAPCCGFPMMVQNPAAAAAMAQKVADSAIRCGADTLVTSGCPGCHYALKGARGIRVEDISGLLYSNYKAGIKE